jgi:hypothetical protein
MHGYINGHADVVGIRDTHIPISAADCDTASKRNMSKKINLEPDTVHVSTEEKISMMRIAKATMTRYRKYNPRRNADTACLFKINTATRRYNAADGAVVLRQLRRKIPNAMPNAMFQDLAIT